MKFLFTIVLICCTTIVCSQIKVEMTPTGFASVKIDRPDKTIEKLVESAKSWATYYNRNSRYRFDVYDVSENALSIDAFKENAFFYRNRGEAYQQRIKYKIRVEFSATLYTLTFSVQEVYTGNNSTKIQVSDFFASDGRLKEDYEEVKPSLEFTTNLILNDFAKYLLTE